MRTTAWAATPMDDEFHDFYSLLGVAFDATFDEIKSAFRRMAKRYHPDLNPDDPEESAVRFRLIHHAYEVLSDPARRRQYDREWQRDRNFEEPPEPPGPAAQVSEADWEFACRYYPDLAVQSERLRRFSETVERRWRNFVFFEKEIDRAADLARSAEEAFLGKLVGASEVLRTLARDALLASHDALLAEFATALRVLGASATEKVIAEICAATIEIEEASPYDTPLRTEKYRNMQIKILPSLVCLVDYNSRKFKYVFEARAAIDANQDRHVPIDPPAPVSPTRRRRS
jgi:curved DNA-binding protein CbpA